MGDAGTATGACLSTPSSVRRERVRSTSGATNQSMIKWYVPGSTPDELRQLPGQWDLVHAQSTPGHRRRGGRADVLFDGVSRRLGKIDRLGSLLDRVCRIDADSSRCVFLRSVRIRHSFPPDGTLRYFTTTSIVMKDCDHCREQSDMPFKCNYCGGAFCETHRLPESHDCDGVRFLSESGKRFESKVSNEIVQSDEDIRGPEPVTPEYTVGSRPDPEYESSPGVELKDSDEATTDGETGFWDRLWQIFT